MIKRHLTGFGLDLVWDGKTVAVMDGENVLEVREAKTGVAAGKTMAEIEEECFIAASAMC